MKQEEEKQYLCKCIECGKVSVSHTSFEVCIACKKKQEEEKKNAHSS